MTDAIDRMATVQAFADSVTDNAVIGHDRGRVSVQVGGVSWSLDPVTARHMAKALRKCADDADRYARKVTATAVPIRRTANGATLHAVDGE